MALEKNFHFRIRYHSNNAILFIFFLLCSLSLCVLLLGTPRGVEGVSGGDSRRHRRALTGIVNFVSVWNSSLIKFGTGGA